MAVNIVTTIDDRVRIQNVIISVFDKSGLEILVAGLLRANPGCRFFATGGSYDHLQGLLGPKGPDHLTAISDFTGQPEMQGGLVKTLDYKIYLGLLSETYNDAHQKDVASRTGGVVFDMVVSNLYPFSETIAQADATSETARSQVDIGGACLIRAGAKNFHRVAVVTDGVDYQRLVELLESSHGTLDAETRFTLARKAFLYVAQYDTAIAEYFINVGSEEMRRCYRFPKRSA